MSRILVVVQWEIKVDQVLCCSFNANGAIWHYIGKGLEPVFWSRGSTAEHTKHTLKHTASVDFANTQHTLLRWILNQWILQIHSTHCFVWFCTSGFCKYRTGTASLDFAPVDFANTQHALLRWILHRFLFAPSCGNHTHCISPLFWFGHTRYIGASNITILVNIVDQTLAAKADMFQEDSYQIEIDSDDHL